MRWWYVVALPTVVFAFPPEVPTLRQVVAVTSRDSLLCLGVPFVQSVTLLLDSLYLLQTPLDYELTARDGCLRFSQHFRRLFRYRDTLTLWVEVQYIPLFVHPRGGAEGEGQRAAVSAHALPQAAKAPAEQENPSTGWQPRGRLVRGVAVQTGSGVQLYSGLELGFESRLVGQTELGGTIVANRLPLSPEGSSVTVQELEQFSLHVRSPGFSAEIGELPCPPRLQLLGVERFQGVRATAQLRDWTVMAALGASQTPLETVSFFGVDGVPGPYRVRPPSSGAALPIVPGSERVWVNGVLRERGEDKDYVIDYWRGELTFRPRCPISSASHIVVEFATAEESAAATLGALVFEGNVGSGQKLGFSYLYRAAPAVPGVPDTAPYTLRNGAAYALVDAATLLGADSSGRGRGWYRRRDTVDGNSRVTIWEYAPGAPDALYMVEFSFVGAAQGDYEAVAPGVFRYVGQRRGQYAPVKLLPLPSRQHRWSLEWAWQLAERWQVRLGGEYQRFQPYRRADALHGVRLAAAAQYSATSDTSASPFVWEGSVRWHNAAFPERRTAAVERSLWEWKLPLPMDELREELLVQQQVRARLDSLRVGASAGWLRQRGGVAAIRWSAVLGLGIQLPVQVTARYTGGRTTELPNAASSLWQRLQGNLLLGGQRWSVQGEARWEWQSASALLPGGQRWAEGTIGALWRLSPIVELELRMPWRHQHQPVASAWLQPSVTFRSRGAVWQNEVAAGWNAVWQRDSLQEFPILRWCGAVELPTVGRFQWRYESGAELAGMSELVFLRVAPGQGNYRYRGDTNGNGRADPEEFEPVPAGGDYVMVTMQSGMRSAGTALRAEVTSVLAFPSASQRQWEWEGRISFSQQRLLLDRWRTLVPRPATAAGVMATRWDIGQRLRVQQTLPWTVAGQWIGYAVWTGVGWELWQRQGLQGSVQCGLAPILSSEFGLEAVSEQRRSAWQGEGNLRGLRGSLQLPCRLSEGVRVTPQISLLAPAVARFQGQQVWVRNLCAGLALEARTATTSVDLTLTYGALNPKEPPTLLLSMGQILNGWSVNGTLRHQTGKATWSAQYFARRALDHSWWHSLIGQVQLTL